MCGPEQSAQIIYGFETHILHSVESVRCWFFNSGGLPALAGFRCAAEEPAVVDVAALYYAGAINVEVNWWGSHATEHTLHATPLLRLCRQIEVAGND